MQTEGGINRQLDHEEIRATKENTITGTVKERSL